MEINKSISLSDIERMMRGIPNFQPRGHGVRIVCQKDSSAQDKGCRNCSYHFSRKNKVKCNLEQNGFFRERIEARRASRKEILTETMAFIRYPPFIRRLEPYIKESERNPMDFRNEKHQAVFAETVKKLDKKNYALMAAVYLLTADHTLGMIAEQRVCRNKIHFEHIHLQNSSTDAYTLYCGAKDLYLGTKNLTVHDLADTKLIPPRLFELLCNAMAIRRFGIDAIQSDIKKE